MRIYNETLVSSAAMTGNVTSGAALLDHMGLAAVHAVWTGTPTGTLKAQASLDGANWIDIPSVTQSLAGSAGGVLWQLTDIGYNNLRVVYTFSSGTGSLTVFVNAKGV